jgi:hypothetical protein
MTWNTNMTMTLTWTMILNLKLIMNLTMKRILMSTLQYKEANVSLDFAPP